MAKTTKLTREGCININTGNIIRSIIPVHIFGHPCKIDKLSELCSKYCINMIEDAAEGLGSYFLGKHVGTFGNWK
tara:strand:- start:218 stop:442 length:225 start_codon:yes stop_codon:yes gene_type:complete